MAHWSDDINKEVLGVKPTPTLGDIQIFTTLQENVIKDLQLEISMTKRVVKRLTDTVLALANKLEVGKDVSYKDELELWELESVLDMPKYVRTGNGQDYRGD